MSEFDEDLAKFGESLSWALMKAFKAFATEQPQAGANIWTGVQSGEVKLRLTAIVGGYLPSIIDVDALLPDGTAQRLAHMTVAPVTLN